MSTYAVKYEDPKGRIKIKEFYSAAARQHWLGKPAQEDIVVIAYSDPR